MLAQNVARRRSVWVVLFLKFNALALKMISADMPFSRCRPVPIQFRRLTSVTALPAHATANFNAPASFDPCTKATSNDVVMPTETMHEDDLLPKLGEVPYRIERSRVFQGSVLVRNG